jgi:hypothetical protein
MHIHRDAPSCASPFAESERVLLSLGFCNGQRLGVSAHNLPLQGALGELPNAKVRFAIEGPGAAAEGLSTTSHSVSGSRDPTWECALSLRLPALAVASACSLRILLIDDRKGSEVVIQSALLPLQVWAPVWLF